MSERPSMRFNKFQKVFKTKETFELNDRGVVPLKEGKELECDKETIYTKLYVKKVRKICLFICAKINKIRLPSEEGPGFIVLQTQLAFSLSSLEKKKKGIKISIWATTHLPLPWPNIHPNLLSIDCCWVRGGVGDPKKQVYLDL